MLFAKLLPALRAVLVAAHAGAVASAGTTADAAAEAAPGEPRLAPAGTVRGMTISCQTWGIEWASEAFPDELDELAELGVNWVAIHPYARIRGDGEVSWRSLDPEQPPAYISRPIAAARERGMSILIVPHLAYWGSPFHSRAEIDFPDPAARARFWQSYSEWIADLAEASQGCDAFCIGSELSHLEADDSQWRALVAAVRARTDAHLTYAANWDTYEGVTFWDALDCIGVQAYFPLAQEQMPSDERLRVSWKGILAPLHDLAERCGKPVVFTELGYNLSLSSASEPWAFEVARGEDRQSAEVLQARLLRVALEVLERENSWLRGAFLWKWFVGPAPGANFVLDAPHTRAVLAEFWTR